MTREEEIDLIKMAYDEDLHYDPRICFKEGIEWADDHPKSPWISVKDDLPCNHSELIDGSSTVEVFAACKDGYFSSTYMIKGLKEWVWFDFKPDYWMIPPKLPKR